MRSSLVQKYALLKSVAADSADIEVVNQLMIDILRLLHDEFAHTSGKQRAAYERAYSLLDCTLSAHFSTRQDTQNPFYVSEVSYQVGRDIEMVLPRPQVLAQKGVS
ncbi:hypothetical protein WBJ53_15240 [Spirosoma sp. SC4-14]|uniref:hypothetical protein n=1 Tax=Spirosoma sp. SC4-14 TaxID=3128900 RepID=UPI0030CF6549